MRLTYFLLGQSLAVAALFAASPVGSVTSSENFVLSGSEIAVSGVPSWPVVAGDQLQTRGASAMLRLSDGSRVVVNRNSRVSLEQVGSATKVKLISGSLRYSLKRESTLEIIANHVSSRTSNSPEGTVWMDGSQGLIAAAISPNAYIPVPIFRPGPLNLPTGGQLTNSNNPPGVTSPGTGSLLPWLSARP